MFGQLKPRFKTVGVIANRANEDITHSLETLIEVLSEHKIQVVIEQECAKQLKQGDFSTVSRDKLGHASDLVVVVGGDGSFLDAARSVVDDNIPVVGINRGNLGFLTDISPMNIRAPMEQIIKGDFEEEARFLLVAHIVRDNQIISKGTALNDVVLYSGDIAKMISFELYINSKFVYRQRSDGIITASPTGSTAYALSCNGPIMHPSLNAIVLVPMNPHNLSSRPIVMDKDVNIEYLITPDNKFNPRLSCDGQVHFNTMPGDRVVIKAHPKALRLIHPRGYDYFSMLRDKLGWTTQRTQN